MQVHGIDMAAGAYEISFEAEGRTIRGLVPETLVAEALARAGRPAHVDAYQWIAAHRPQIETALTRMARGAGRPRPPYDRLTLLKES